MIEIMREQQKRFPSPSRKKGTGSKHFTPYQHTQRRQPNLDFDPYASFTARSQAPSSPGDRARQAARWLKEQRQSMNEESYAHQEYKQRALNQDRANREKLKLDSRESLDAKLIPLLGDYSSIVLSVVIIVHIFNLSSFRDYVFFGCL